MVVGVGGSWWICFGWWDYFEKCWVVMGLFWVVVDDGRFILGDGGWRWIILGCGEWWWVYLGVGGWWWLVVGLFLVVVSGGG